MSKMEVFKVQTEKLLHFFILRYNGIEGSSHD